MTGLVSVEDALDRILSSASPIADIEQVDLHNGAGRVLASDLKARLTYPAFDNSAMDGYAVRHEDISAPDTVLSVIGQSAAGHGFSGSIGPGQTVRIFTGAPVPTGTDTILIQEDAEVLDDGRIRPTFETPKGRHIRPAGQDFAEGDVILRAGDVMDAGRLTVAATMNHPGLSVYRRPRVALLATGDELLLPGSTPGADQIIASNSYGVAAIARDNGADAVDLGIVRDDRAAITSAVRAARESGIDVLVTLGGASVGDHDLVRPALLDAGMVLDFWRIAMRPGKPLMVGALDGMHVLGLPGNPVSSLVCSTLFLEPLLRKLGHLPARHRIVPAKTATDLPANDKRQDYVRARMTRARDGAFVVQAFGRQDSSMIRVFAHSNALIIREPNAPPAKAGDECQVMVVRDIF